jgi:hypothetical protein
LTAASLRPTHADRHEAWSTWFSGAAFQQDIYRPGTAVAVARRAVGEHFVTLLQPAADFLFEYRCAVAGAAPLAVHDAHALDTLAFARVQKRPHRLAGDRHGHAVQVQFGADDKQAAAQFLQRTLLQTGTDKQQFFTGFHFRRFELIGQQVPQHLGFIAFAELRPGADRVARWHDTIVMHGSDVAHAVAKQLNIVCIGFFHLAN